MINEQQFTEHLLKGVYKAYWDKIPNIFGIPSAHRFQIYQGYLPMECVKRILFFDSPKKLEELDQSVFESFEKEVQYIINGFDGKVFPKILEKSSTEIKFYSDNKYITKANEFLGSFLDDPEIYDKVFLSHKKDGEEKKKITSSVSYQLVKYEPLKPMLEEVRLFIINRDIYEITQYCVPEQIEQKKVALKPENFEPAKDFYNSFIRPYVDMDNFVCDIGFKMDGGDPVLIEFNPIFQSHPCMLAGEKA
jgi:hypothetical protein